MEKLKLFLQDPKNWWARLLLIPTLMGLFYGVSYLVFTHSGVTSPPEGILEIVIYTVLGMAVTLYAVVIIQGGLRALYRWIRIGK